MIHINTLALFMFEQGLQRKKIFIVFLSGVLNIPYYFVLIFTTYYFKDEILLVAENPYGLFFLLFIWLGYGIYQEYKDKKSKKFLVNEH
jgi:membrane-associated protein